jgi:hypothetical protein
MYMEADWSVEVGSDLPTIAVPWEGFVHLRRDPLLASSLIETADSSILAQSLIRLNQESSPVFTSKCDHWLLSAEEIDPLEFDAEARNAEWGIACYIDIIARNQALFASFHAHEAWVRSLSNGLRQTKLPQARVELVVRAANVDAREGFAITLYTAACGASEAAAEAIFQAALEAAVTITMKQAASAGE